MKKNPTVREVEDTTEAVIDASISQAKALINHLIDALYDADLNNVSIGEICQAADTYTRLAQVHVTQQQTEQLKRIADALDLRGEAKAAPATLDGSEEEFRANRKQAEEFYQGMRRGMGLDTDDFAEARTDYADPLN